MTITNYTLTTNPDPIYTSVGNTAITSLTFCNYSPANVTANVYVVPNGDSPTTNNIMLASLLIQSGDTYQIYQAAEKLLLGPGDSICASATSITSINSVTSYTST
jgi:hypothetical protein